MKKKPIRAFLLPLTLMMLTGCGDSTVSEQPSAQSEATSVVSAADSQEELVTYKLTFKNETGIYMTGLKIRLLGGDQALEETTNRAGYVKFRVIKEDYRLEVENSKGYTFENLTFDKEALEQTFTGVGKMLPFAETLADGSVSAGSGINDFTVKTGKNVDGELVETENTLSDLLKDHKAVYINLFATWCGPCKMEFPYLNDFYNAHNDDVAFLVLSAYLVDSTYYGTRDTAEKVASYRDTNNLDFEIGMDTVNLNGAISLEAYPTSILINQDGKIVKTEVGAMTTADAVNGFFDGYYD